MLAIRFNTSLGPGSPSNSSINATTGELTWTPLSSQVGSNAFAVLASDGTLSSSTTVTVNVTNPTSPTNRAPTINDIADQSVVEGEQLQLTVVATDPDQGDSLTYALLTTGLAGSPQLDATTGVFTWTPPFADGPGAQIEVQVTDSGGLSDTETFSVFVSDRPDNNVAPVLNPITAQNANIGSELTFTVTATDADVPADTLTYFLDPTAPTDAAISSTTGVFAWTPTVQGTFTFPVFVNDGTVTVSQNVTINVGAATANQPPSFGPIGNQTAEVNSELQFQLAASDADNDTLTYSFSDNGASRWTSSEFHHRRFHVDTNSSQSRI